MELINGEIPNDLLQAQAHIWNHSFNFIKSMSLKCAVELGIPDVIHSHGQPMTLSELVSALQIHPSKSHHIYRLMRVLVHSGFFLLQKFNDNRHGNGYSLTQSSLLLLKDCPISVRPYVLAVLDPTFTKPWHFLSSWFQNIDHPTPFSIAHGKNFWDFASKDARFNSSFNEAMASDSSIVSQAVISECKEVFKGLNSLVDVGGNTGAMTKAIAETFPNLNCTVLDLPHVVAGLQGTKNLNFLAGNMLESIPPADAILLKMILHVFGDEDCLKILKKCREAIVSNGEGLGKVIIIDIVMESQNWVKQSTEITQLYDLEMMVLVSGQERNEKEWAKLFFDAGFTTYKINPVLGLRSIIEVFP